MKWKRPVDFKLIISVILIISIHSKIPAQEVLFNDAQKIDIQANISVYQLKRDTLEGGPQKINVLEIKKIAFKDISLDWGYHEHELLTTSTFANNHNAIAAINGGFYDMQKGGSVSYFERKDTTIHYTRKAKNKWTKPSSLLNGAFVIDTSGMPKIMHAQSDGFYEESNMEASVLITGPLLLKNSMKLELENSKFVRNRHPRTCVCETEKSFLLIAIDGRRSNALGMNLYELQDLLQTFQCKDAINLDGGGSTTMWISGHEVINQPSDFFGERKVANALLVLKNKKIE